VLRRRIDFILIEGAPKSATTARPKLETHPRATVQRKKKVGKELDRVQQQHVERGAKPRTSGGEKPRLGVSHRGLGGAGGGGGGRNSRSGGRKKRR
jgi:hypothetical protein